MSKEVKHWRIKHCPRPYKHPCLTSAVIIYGADNRQYYCYISFSQTFVEAVGRKLPQGVSEFRTAFLVATIRDQQIKFTAHYSDDTDLSKGVEMWTVDIVDEGLPEWLRFHLPKVQHGSDETSAARIQAATGANAA